MPRNLKVNAYIELSTRWLSLKELSFAILKIAEICARLLTRMEHYALLLTFGILGNLASVITFMSPLSTFVKIYKGKSVLEYRPLPYIISLVSQMFWLYYGCVLIQGKLFIVLVSVIGCVSQTAYIAVYVFYATVDLRRHVFWLIASIDVGVFSAIFFPSYFAITSVEYRDFFVGSSCVLSSIVLFASPLTTVWQVIQSGSVEFMPLPLSVSLVLNAGCWMAYGLVTHNIYLLIPNGLGILLGLAQVMVYLYYRYL